MCSPSSRTKDIFVLLCTDIISEIIPCLIARDAFISRGCERVNHQDVCEFLLWKLIIGATQSADTDTRARSERICHYIILMTEEGAPEMLFFRVRSLHASAFAPSGESDWSSESELNARVRIWVCRGGRGGEKRGIPPVGQIFASPSHWSVSDRSFVLHKAGHSSKAAIKSRTFSPIILLTWTPTPSPADVPAGVVAHFCPVQLSKKDSYICVHVKNVRKVAEMQKSRVLCTFTWDSAGILAWAVWHRGLAPNRRELQQGNGGCCYPK